MVQTMAAWQLAPDFGSTQLEKGRVAFQGALSSTWMDYGTLRKGMQTGLIMNRILEIDADDGKQ
jgi:hypothetical protein